MNRRNLLKLSASGMGLALIGGSHACKKNPESIGILKPGDKISLKEDAEQILKKAYELGFKYEEKNFGCARCTVAALQDAVPFVERNEVLFRGSTCLDGGATPSKIANCGAFSGSAMVIAYVCGTTREGEIFKGDTDLVHDLIHKVWDRFDKEYGSVLCKDIRVAMDKNCPEVVGRAARWATEVLISEFAKEALPV